MKRLLMITMLTGAILLSGCMESIEINERAFVTVMAMDRSGDNILMTLLTEGKNGKQSISGTGKTIAEALRNAELSLPDGTTLFTGHTQLFIAGKSVVPDSGLVRLLTAEYGVPPSCKAVCAFNGGDAARQVSDNPEKQINYAERQGLIKSLTLAEISRKDSGGFFALPFAEYENNDVFFLKTAFITPGGGKVVTDRDENAGYMLLSGNADGMLADISTSCGYGALTVTKAEPKFEFTATDGKSVCRVDLTAQLKTDEKCGKSGSDVPKDEVLKLSAENALRKYCTDLIDKTDAWQPLCTGEPGIIADRTELNISVKLSE
ncbi:MAG: hypothetical protein MSH60_03760 [Ruminococcus sp.]|nr:hypothetical protein [Ruminococcus sp.]